MREMRAVVPWTSLCVLIEPHYPKGDRSRPPVGIELGREPAPDETTICKFRQLLDANKLWEEILQAVNDHLAAKGVKNGNGTIMDATIFSAPFSTKNKDGERDAFHAVAPDALDRTNRRGSRGRRLSEDERARNRTKSGVRAKVAHPFLILKRIFGFEKVCYRGIDKNSNRLYATCALVNIYIQRRYLLRRCAA